MISVCVATYNGEKYIEQQLRSIVRQLSVDDEVIVSDDGSSDKTIEIVEKLRKEYQQIHMVKGPKKGYASNFGYALSLAKGDIVFLSDQDDIWKDDKVKKVKAIFENDPMCTTVLHTMSTFRNGDINKATEEINISYVEGAFKNWYKGCYWGCCMAVKTEFAKKMLPFRPFCSGHDLLIGMISETYGKTVFLNEQLIYHRMHDTNTSGKLPFIKKITFRINLAEDYFRTKKNMMMKI